MKKFHPEVIVLAYRKNPLFLPTHLKVSIIGLSYNYMVAESDTLSSGDKYPARPMSFCL